MNRQITECRFNAYIDDGTNKNVISGFPTNVRVYSGAYTYRPYYYTGSAFDESLNGTLRSQLGGYRFEAVLNWERLTNSTPLISLLNNAYTTTSGEVIIEFYPDATNTTVYENVVISDSSWQSTLDATMVRQPLSVSLTGKEVKQQIPTFYVL